jgi:hypothetical protein
MRTTLTRLGAPALAALILAACSGGGGGTSVPRTSPLTSPSTTPTSAPTTGSQARLVVKIPRSTSKSGYGVKASARRSPRYVSVQAEGLQITVTAGATTKTSYVDISSTNAATCTTTTTTPALPATILESCTVTIPWLAASESISVIETDETPTDENQSTGLGDGFPSGTNILAMGSTQATLTPGVLTSISLGLSPIVDNLFDVTFLVALYFGTYYPGLDSVALATPTFQDDGSIFNPGVSGRIVVTSGTPVQGVLATSFEDAEGSDLDVDTTALPFVNLAGAAAPLTVTSSASDVTIDPYVNTGFANTFSALPQASASTAPSTPIGYAQTATIPTDGYQWIQYFFLTGFYYDGSTTAASTLTFATAASTATATATLVANGSTTPTPFTVGPYSGSYQYTVAPVSAAPTTATTSLTSGTPVTVTGGDPGAPSAMYASNSCAGTGAATIARNGSSNAFTVTPVVAGTCTLQLFDSDTNVPSNTVTITIGGYTTPGGFTSNPSSLAFDLVTNDNPATLTIADSAGSLTTGSASIACVANPASGNAVATVAFADNSASSATVTVTPGTATGLCEVTINDGSGNKLGVPMSVTENAIGVFAKHRNTK